VTTIVDGIDEAGFGPVLGPMVVTAIVYQMPLDLLGVSMWEALAGAVCRKPSAKRRGMIAVGDSKKLYSGLRGGGGLEHLERGVLSMLAATGQRPATLEALLAAVSPGTADKARACPWYQGLDLPLPRDITAAGLALDCNSIQARLARAGIKPLAMRSEILLESEFNRLVTAGDNKSALLFDVSCRLLEHVWRKMPRTQHSHIFVDHQGGRVHYREGLMRVFDGCQFKINDESETRSSYTLLDADRTLEIEFLVQAEDRHLPVALASMLSKYVRELFMGVYNKYWATHLPDLAPTAGYYTDGRRFFAQIQPVIQTLGLDAASLYRCR